MALAAFQQEQLMIYLSALDHKDSDDNKNNIKVKLSPTYFPEIVMRKIHFHIF